MTYAASFFNHARAAHAAAAGLGIQAEIRAADLALRLDFGGRQEVWLPKFVTTIEGRLLYTDASTDATIGFGGWLPYQRRQWPIGTGKTEFKRFAIAADVPTPVACFDPARIGGPFIIKQSDSSFGEGIRGPFLRYDATDPAQELASNEFYENFILGPSAKVWCWGSECVAVHIEQPSVVTGDGKSTLGDLVLALPNSRKGHNWELIARLAQYCGIDSQLAVVPAGKEVAVEYRIGSRYRTTQQANRNILADIAETDLGAQFKRAAAVFAEGVSPDPAKRQAVFTLDAVIDGDGLAWFLEMNCNPLVHPDGYARMMASKLRHPCAAIEQLTG